jgi:hypothetical protein
MADELRTAMGPFAQDPLVGADVRELLWRLDQGVASVEEVRWEFTHMRMPPQTTTADPLQAALEAYAWAQVADRDHVMPAQRARFEVAMQLLQRLPHEREDVEWHFRQLRCGRMPAAAGAGYERGFASVYFKPRK